MEIVGLAFIVGLVILPMLAKTWRSLFWLSLLALTPAIISGIIMFSGYGVAFLAVVGFGLPVALGVTARAISLYAEKKGLPRPDSLVIEAVFIIVIILFVLNM